MGLDQQDHTLEGPWGNAVAVRRLGTRRWSRPKARSGPHRAHTRHRGSSRRELVCTACMTRDSSGRLYLLDASLPLPSRDCARASASRSTARRPRDIADIEGIVECVPNLDLTRVRANLSQL